MSITVFGAGAIGGCVAAQLALAGIDVAVLARGATLAAIQQRGLRLRHAGQESIAQVRAVADPAELGPQETVIICCKAYSLASAAPALAKLIGPRTTIVAVQNGIPWWYFYRAGTPFDGQPISAVDPHGALLRQLPPARVVGCIAYLAASIIQPGIVELAAPGRFVLGEPDGTASVRLDAVAAALRRGGFDVDISNCIREAIWMKLWGNLPLNTVSALTLANVSAMTGNAGVRSVLGRMMEEMCDIARRLGVHLEMDIQERINQASRLGTFKTSMLQDIEAGRPLEIDAIIGAVSELGRRLHLPTPTIDIVESLLRLRAPSIPCQPS